MKTEDIKYLLTNLANLIRVPIRMYENNTLSFYYSIVQLVKDPFSLYEEKALYLEDDISYYQTPDYYYYGILNIGAYKIVIGPTRQFKITKQELITIAFNLAIPKNSMDYFVLQMEAIGTIPLMTLLQILCMLNLSLTGNKKSLEDVAIHELEQRNIMEEIGQQYADRTVEKLEGHIKSPYNAFDTENRLMDMVKRGDVAAINEFIAHAPLVKEGMVAQEQLRQSKNIFIVTATLVSRAAIRGGMDIASSLALSDAYIQKCELADSLAKITELSYRMVLDYTEKVAKIKIGDSTSILVSKVSNYIQQHLSEAIKVNDIANALFMGRSRLSTDFKKETGLNLSAYIMSQKIDEAKRLLRYSDRTFAAISLYLGFSSQSHFSKVFKLHTDLTPFEYRQLNKTY